MNSLSRYRGHRALRQVCRLIASATIATVSLLIPLQSRSAATPCGKPPAFRPVSMLSSPSSQAGRLSLPARPLSRDNGLNSHETPYHLMVHSNIAAVADADTSQLLYGKNPDKVTPIASITKLMTAIVTLDAKLPLADVIEVSDEDVDDVKGTRSFLPVGSRLTREDMLHIALMASENRAAACLSRYYP